MLNEAILLAAAAASFMLQPQGLPAGTACIYQLVDAPDPMEYLWQVYQRTPKIDRLGDFQWKDAAAAEKAGMTLKEYVIGGLTPEFRMELFSVIRAMTAAGLEVGITSGYRDDYRQSIAKGNKSAVGDSYHGGSRRGGYGQGRAADIVSLGRDRKDQLARNPKVWKWVDEHGRLFNIARPYGDRDAPHVAPLWSGEFQVAAHIAKKKILAKRKIFKKPLRLKKQAKTRYAKHISRSRG